MQTDFLIRKKQRSLITSLPADGEFFHCLNVVDYVFCVDYVPPSMVVPVDNCDFDRCCVLRTAHGQVKSNVVPTATEQGVIQTELGMLLSCCATSHVHLKKFLTLS